MSGDTNIGNVGGDFIGGDQHIHGDKVSGDKIMGDKVQGDKITVGNISGSSDIAIGSNITQNINSGNVTNNATVTVFNQVRQSLEAANLTDNDREDAEDAIAKLEVIAADENGDPKRARRFIDVLADAAPSVAEAAVNLLLGNPGAVAGQAVEAMLKQWKSNRD